MRLQEYQGKELFKGVGIPVSEGRVATTPEEAEQIAQDFGGEVVVKAQVLVGGRGKAGGIKLASTPLQARKAAEAVLGSEIKGEKVSEVLITKAVDIEKEFYLGVTLDRSQREPVVIFSAEGGVDIEEVAKEMPQAVFRFHISPLEGIHPYQIRNVLFKAGINKDLFRPLYDLFEKLYSAFTKYKANLVEINPLALTPAGQLVAIDSKFIIDDDALDAAPEEVQLQLASWRNAAAESPQERVAREADLNYVKLDGNIGIIGNGAGLVMATLDVVQLMGGRPANFLDVGGGASAEQISKALEIVLSDIRVEGLFINIFGGITRCDEVAKGLVEAKERRCNLKLKVEVPMVVRLTGTNEERGREILERNGISPVSSMEEGAQKVVEFTG